MIKLDQSNNRNLIIGEPCNFLFIKKKKYAYSIVLMKSSYQDSTVNNFGEMMRKVIMHAHVSGMVEKVKMNMRIMYFWFQYIYLHIII